MYEKYIYYKWVPTWLKLLVSALIVMPIIVAGGIYNVNISLTYSGLGTLYEDVSFAYFATNIGMILGLAMFLKVKLFFRAKEILLTGLTLMALSNIWIFHTQNIMIIDICSFLIGYIKILVMMTVVSPPIITLITPKFDRGIFYSTLYPVILGGSQLAYFFFAKFSNEYSWKHVYILMAIVLLICDLLVLIFVHNKRLSKQIPIKNIDWISIAILLTIMFIINYICVYMKQLYYLNPFRLHLALGSLILTICIFIIRQLNMERPIVDMRIFLKRNTFLSMIFFFLLGMFIAASYLQSSFMSILKYDQVTKGELYLASVAGIICAGFASFYWFRMIRRIKPLLFVAFGCLQAYIVLEYFMINTQMDVHYFILPMFFRGAGFALTYIGCGVYFAVAMPPRDFLTTLPFLIAMRSFIGIAFFLGLYRWQFNIFQTDAITHLANNMDANDFLDIERGKTLYATVKQQAVLIASKKMFGYIAIVGTILLTFIFGFPFRKLPLRRLAKIKRRAGFQSSSTNRKSQASEENKELEEIVSALP